MNTNRFAMLHGRTNPMLSVSHQNAHHISSLHTTCISSRAWSVASTMLFPDLPQRLSRMKNLFLSTIHLNLKHLTRSVILQELELPNRNMIKRKTRMSLIKWDWNSLPCRWRVILDSLASSPTLIAGPSVSLSFPSSLRVLSLPRTLFFECSCILRQNCCNSTLSPSAVLIPTTCQLTRSSQSPSTTTGVLHRGAPSSSRISAWTLTWSMPTRTPRRCMSSTKAVSGMMTEFTTISSIWMQPIMRPDGTMNSTHTTSCEKPWRKGLRAEKMSFARSREN